MCREKWNTYTCGHIISARQDQDGFEHCDHWVEGREETGCANYDPDGLLATEEVGSMCQECEYLTPPTSSEDEEEG